MPIVIFLLGLVGLLYGCYLIAPAAALIVGGILFMAIAVNVERGNP